VDRIELGGAGTSITQQRTNDARIAQIEGRIAHAGTAEAVECKVLDLEVGLDARCP
jgi:hypothetical protein